MKKCLPVEEKRIIASMQYLKMLVLNSESDGTHDLIPHSSIQLGEHLDNITVINAYAEMNNAGFRNRFQIQLYASSTVYQLK